MGNRRGGQEYKEIVKLKGKNKGQQRSRISRVERRDRKIGTNKKNNSALIPLDEEHMKNTPKKIQIY